MTVLTLYPNPESESTPHRAFTLSLFDIPSVPRVKVCARCPMPVSRSSRYCPGCQREYGRVRRQLPHVKEAQKRHGKNYRTNNAARVAAYMRVYHLANTYGLTVADYDAMKAEQGGVCAICKQPPLEHFWDGRVKELCIDHDHETGKVRGLLCGLCNKGIGNFRDNPRLMTEAIGYLEKHCPSPLS